MPSPYLSNLPRPSARRPRWQVLLLLQSDHLYPKHIHNPVFAEFAPEYFRRETNLLGYLAGLTGVAVKLCPVEFGWGQNAWIAAAYPTIELLHYGRFPKLACFARCCIVDYNSTGFLELLAMNRPFLATWDRHWWRGPVAFEQHLDALMECGVFHDSPTHLTRTHMQVGADIETWWAEPRRQQAVKAMARSYAWATPDWLEHWRRFLSGGPGSRSVPPVYALPNNQ